ncbi:DsbA family protein [Microbacterium enclense]|uniref:DsbA family protein n=1 Tax=Microbacterium enclense TaxID=993073 RepID=UPI0036DD63F7
MTNPQRHRPRFDTAFRRQISAACLAGALLVVVGVGTGCTPFPPEAAERTQASPIVVAAPTIPTGTRGAMNFDDGYVKIGTGKKTVEVWLDPMCAECRSFAQTSLPSLFTDGLEERATLRIHPVAVQAGQAPEADYSTRASAMLAAIAAEEPSKAIEFLRALYEHQPASNDPGLSDQQLQDLAREVGVESTFSDLTGYREWVAQATATAGSKTSHLPAVTVDDKPFSGHVDDPEEFAAFYRED